MGQHPTGPNGLTNSDGVRINPATKDKQDEIIAKMPVLEENGGVPVNLQDQTSQSIIVPFVNKLSDTSLTADTVIDAYTVSVVSVTNMSVGDHIRIINAAADKFYFGTILAINALVVTVDTPLDFVYVSGSNVTGSNINMAVNGSVTPVTFCLRTGSPSIPSEVDITRFVLQCQAESAVDLNKFGDLAALTNGLVLRRVNGEISNILNVKSNAELSGIAYDWQPYTASNPAQAVDGFACRLTFAGQNKIGVVIRIGQDENLEFIVQDDLTGLTSLIITAEGHVVQN